MTARPSGALPADAIEIDENALDHIAKQTHGSPFFLQEWGYQAWNAASASPISLADVKRAARAAVGRLDEGFFKVRVDRLTRREKDYMHAMASLGAGPHRSGDIAAALKKKVNAVAPLRGLIKKGIIYSPPAWRDGLHCADVRRLFEARRSGLNH